MSGGLRVKAELRLPAFTLHAAFSVPPGVTVLFGPSGAGKSLALQAIAGLAPLTSGHIALADRTLVDPATRIAVPARLRHIGYVPQHYALFPHLTVAGNVAYALPVSRWQREARARRDARVRELLALVRLEGFEERWPRQLSGGQAQRVALARALAAEPKALLLDEPLGALDAPTRAAVQDDLRAVVRASGVPTLIVTHDLGEARALGDRMVVLVGGRVAAEGALAEVLAAPPTAAAALLLGWRNVLPIGNNVVTDGELRAELACGQTLTLPADPTGDGDTSGEASGLALRADRMELLALASAASETPDNTLAGVLAAASDRGAYCLVTVALDGPGAATLAITCSPREWSALGMRLGERIAVNVPDDAARVVRVREGGTW